MKTVHKILISFLAVLILCSAAYASIAWMKEFNNLYKPADGSDLKKAKCLACHIKPTGKDGNNAYGKLLEKKKPGAAALKAIEKLDADKDGFSNLAEIKAGKLPGDAKSKPAKK